VPRRKHSAGTPNVNSISFVRNPVHHRNVGVFLCAVGLRRGYLGLPQVTLVILSPCTTGDKVADDRQFWGRAAGRAPGAERFRERLFWGTFLLLVSSRARLVLQPSRGIPTVARNPTVGIPPLRKAAPCSGRNDSEFFPLLTQRPGLPPHLGPLDGKVADGACCLRLFP
jgi:hypothetical protein